MNWDAIAALAGVVAAFVAAWQLGRLRMDALNSRAAEIDSVTLSTLVRERPSPLDAVGTWVYEFTITNPGRLPISNVQAVVHFPCEVRRRHYDGSVDPPTRTLELAVAVIGPGASHGPRRRTVLISETERAALRDVQATVSFRTPDAGDCTTRWPAPPRKPSGPLRKRLQRRPNLSPQESTPLDDRCSHRHH